jgi:hypothetical protein
MIRSPGTGGAQGSAYKYSDDGHSRPEFPLFQGCVPPSILGEGWNGGFRVAERAAECPCGAIAMVPERCDRLKGRLYANHCCDAA